MKNDLKKIYYEKRFKENILHLVVPKKVVFVFIDLHGIQNTYSLNYLFLVYLYNMGAGILPTTIHNGKLYFLFGKEGKYEDSAPGFSDFGGGTDNNETFIETAIREAGEEFTGFLGNDIDVRKMLKKHGTYNIDYNSKGHKIYRMHIFPFEYNEWLPYYYNNNQRFLQKRLDPKVIKNSKIFEKAEIKWVPINELKKMRPQFRSYFQNILDIMLNEQDKILKFIQKYSKINKKTLKQRKYKRNITNHYK